MLGEFSVLSFADRIIAMLLPATRIHNKLFAALFAWLAK